MAKKRPPASSRIRSLSQRSAGLLLHPTSLPNPYPIGDIGPAAHAFIDFLSASGLHWWQMLPISPIGAGNSPYQSFSSFAANTLLISPDGLADAGWLKRSQLDSYRADSKNRVDFAAATAAKQLCIESAFDCFASTARARDRSDLDQFVHEQRLWLPDFALFMAIRAQYGGRKWWLWDWEIRKRIPQALASARRTLARDIRFYEFSQWQFSLQWNALRQKAAQRGVGLIGDLPIFVSADSADVWAHPSLFAIGRDGSPAYVAGVPPDYFAKTGQLWGNPHYRWPAMKKDGYAWWTERLKTVLHFFDAVRIDHFIGFVRYYEIPAKAKTAEAGTYKAGPGADFFHRVLRKLGARGKGSLIVEDLGVVTPAVKALRDHFGFPGMKVLQFAFGSDPEALNYQPHRYPANCVVYTGTHDNNTTPGWLRSEASPEEIKHALRYLNCARRDLNWALIGSAIASVGNTVILPVQDILGLGREGRMNIPGTAAGNWEWRMRAGALTPALAARLRGLSKTYQRID